ncbi:MAG: Do family serine endopeptidase [Cyclobacteriaceae bacterium]
MISRKHFLFGLIFASLFGGLIALGGFHLVYTPEEGIKSFDQVQPVKFTSNFDTASIAVPDGLNFVHAAEVTMPSVVHIRSTFNGSGHTASRNPLDEMFRDYFGDRFREREGQQRRGRSTGSGVIISGNGYIVTNNHVIDNADDIEVLLNDNRTYAAKIVGTDPTTDLALLKIEESNLPYLTFGDSDDLRIGEWVLAVGNPFEFRSTVTAGIVSQKARNINILRDRSGLQIEAFIQTDAAVNPGNSGGALVDLKGRLVGINTAIATHTGSFEGYSFAVPASLVNKIMDDLLEFGVVQRALLGVNITDVNAQLAEDQGLEILTGIFIMRVNEGSAAFDAGIQEGDVITKVGDVDVKNVAELQEQIARRRPGDKVEITYVRDGDLKSVLTTLKNTQGNTEIVEARNSVVIEGATFEEISAEEQEALGIDGGAKLSDVGNGKWSDAGIDEGFIVTSIDKQVIRNVQDLRNALLNKSGGTLIEGIYPNGDEAFYGIGW